MTDSIFDQTPKIADPFMAGLGGAAMLGLGFPITMGLAFPDMSGPVILYRRKVYPGAVGDWHVAGTAHVDAGSVVNCDGCTHANSSGWEYAAARALGNGFVSELSEPIRVDIDSGGSIITDLPTWPRDLAVVAKAGGTFDVSWVYTDYGQNGWPTDFRVYRGVDADSIDYGTVLATVTFDPSAVEYVHTTDAYGDGTPHAFAVRARNSDGDAELNERTTDLILAEDGTPNAATIVSGVVAPAGA